MMGFVRVLRVVMRLIFDFFKKFFPYIKGYVAWFVVAIISSILVALSTAGITYLIEPLMDTLSGKIPRATPLFSFESIAQSGKIAIFMSLMIVLVYFIKAAGSYVQTYCMNHIGQDIVRKLRDEMLFHMLQLEMAFFNKMRGGELIARITNDIGIIRLAVSNYITEFIRESITILALVGVVIYQSPKFALIGLVIMPLAIIPLSAIIKKLKKYARNIQEKNADITAKLNEIFNNIEVVKASNGEKIESKSFAEQNLSFFKLSMKSVKVGELTTPLMELLGAIMLSCVIYIAIVDIHKGAMSAAQFSSFVGALLFIFTPFKRLVNLYTQMQNAIVASDRIFEILNKKPVIIDGDKKLDSAIESVEFKNVKFSYSDEVHALHGVNLLFQKNKITALVGKSGSGKSSIVNLMLRLYEATSGEILINNQLIKNYTQKSIRDNMAIVTQRVFIFNDSVLKNVAYNNEIDENRAIEALKKAYAWEFVSALPNGIHTILDEFGANLSGGQRQRIAIARAIYKNPCVFIFDEATSALDIQTEEAIKSTLQSLRKDKILVMIAHRPSTIELADEVIHINDGNIIKIESKS